MSSLSLHRRNVRPRDHREKGRLRLIVASAVLPIMAACALPAGAAAAAGSIAGNGTKLVISSNPISAPANASATNAITIKLESASGVGTTTTSALKIYLFSSSTGHIFAATSGGAAENFTTLPAATKSVTVYYGDTNAGSPTITASLTSPPSNGGLTEATQSETITAGNTTTVLAAAPTANTFGALETLTATTKSAAGVPSGSVTFSNGTTALCSAVATSGGVATCSVATLPVGKASLTAAFTSGSANFGGSTSKAVKLTVTAAATTTTLASSANPASFGSPVTLTSQVSGPGGTPTGTVTFDLGSTVLCKKVALSSGSAACVTSALAIGTNSLTAVFSSSSTSYANSASAPLSLGMGAASTTTTLTSGTGPTVAESVVLLTSTVSSTAGTPSGTVTFDLGSAPVCADVALISGTAHCTINSLDAGSAVLTAVFTSSSVDYAGSTSSPLSLTVAAVATSTVLSGSVSTGSYGSAVVFTAQVSDSSDTPVGTVTFSSDTSGTLCADIVLVAGSASCSVSNLDAGSYSVTATYSSSSVDDAGSTSSAVSYTVNPISTATSLSSSLSPAPYGSSVTFTAAVSSAVGTPAGTVTFSLGVVPICANVPVNSGTGTATCLFNSLPLGSNLLTASFASSSVNYVSSSSAAVTQSMTPAVTTTVLSSSDGGASTWPSSPVETATVTAATGAQPSGAVAFFENGSPVEGCAAVTFSPGVPAQCPIGTPDAGTYAITAVATPATAHDAASSSNTVTEVVGAASTTTTLGSSALQSTYGASVTLTATESTGPGTVAFFDGSSVVCASVPLTGGVAWCSISTLPVGVNTLSAVTTSSSIDYSGSTSGSVSITVNPGPGSQLVISSAPFVAVTGASPVNSFTITLEDSYGNPTTSATAIKIFLAGSSSGRHFSATSGGTAINSVVLAAGANSVTLYYGDTNVGTPTINVSLTSPPSSAGLVQGTQVETIT